MDTLYLFRLDENTGKLTRIAIPQKADTYRAGAYEKIHWGVSKQYYKYTMHGTTYYTDPNDIDKFKNWRVYSFNSDKEHAMKIIQSSLQERQQKAYEEYSRYTEVLNRLSNN